MQGDFEAVPGKAYRVRRYDELGKPEIVVLDGRVAKRCRYLGRVGYFGTGDDEIICVVFMDTQTEEVYAQAYP